ncbi:aldo/keto reductase, partial [Corallococcus exiguus]|nr:aldo/keto reductase [Corallococcus exiguus]
MERRSFLQGAVLGAGLTGTSLAGAGSAGAAVSVPPLPNARPQDPADLPLITDPGELRGEMLYRTFGRTSEKISAIGMGGLHLGKSAVTDDEATRLIHEGVDRGITFMDNCWD